MSQSLTESLTEAIEDEVPISCSVPKDDVTPMASLLDVPPRPQPPTAIVTLAVAPASPVSASARGSLSAVKVKDVEDTQIPEVANPPASEDPGGDATKAEKPSFGDWVGTWWVKPKGKSRAPPVPFSPAEDNSESGKETPSITFPSDGISSAHSVPNTPNTATTKRKPTRSVFGTLGFSILNPGASSSLSSLAAKNRRNMSVTDVSGVDERRNSLSTRSAHVSPSNSPLLSPTTLHSDLSRVASSSHLRSPVPSVVLPDEKPPQGSSLRAIIQATRVMTTDASSVLSDQGRETSPVIAQMAFELVRNAREGRLDFRERPKERKERMGGNERHDL